MEIARVLTGHHIECNDLPPCSGKALIRCLSDTSWCSWIDTILFGNFWLLSRLSRVCVCVALTTYITVITAKVSPCFFLEGGTPLARFFLSSLSLGCCHNWGWGGQELPSPVSAVEQQTIQLSASMLSNHWVPEALLSVLRLSQIMLPSKKQKPANYLGKELQTELKM